MTSARDLARLYEEVERGRGEDHPKLNALRRLLAGTATLMPVRSAAAGVLALAPLCFIWVHMAASAWLAGRALYRIIMDCIIMVDTC